MLTLCWLWSLVSFGVAKAYKRPEHARQSGKILAWLSGVGFLAGALVWLALFPSPTRIYQGTFGENPSADVTDLRGDDDSYYDSSIVKLRFQAAPSTIRRLTKIQNLRRVSVDQRNINDLMTSDTPQWWQPQITAHTQLYEVERKKEVGSFANKSVWLCYDSQTRTAYFSFIGFD